MQLKRILIRNAEAPELIELFLIGSIVSVLVIRAFLAATGYPQIGGEGLHIAHMLWGGVFMVVALLLLFTFLGHVTFRLAAVLAGAGFGTFIDELGKFITNDNDYFFQPTVGIIYIIFISMFLLLRTLRQRRENPPEMSLANVLNRLEGSVTGRMDLESKRKITDLLLQSDPQNPLVGVLKSYVEDLQISDTDNFRLLFRIRDSLKRGYAKIVLNRVTIFLLTALFVFISFVQVVAAIALLGFSLAVERPEEVATFVGGAQVASAAFAGVMILYGARWMRSSRIVAYRWFVRGVLVNIFITQLFSFFDSQLSAMGGLTINVLLYIALRFMIEREESLSNGGLEITSASVEPAAETGTSA